MRALVVAPQPFYSPRGTPLSVYHRTRITAELGVEIDFLTYGEGQDVDLPGVRFLRIPRFGFTEPIPVGPSRAKAFLDLFVIAYTLRLLLGRRYDFVHAHEESVFFLRFLKPIFGYKLVYDMHSSLPQQLTNFAFTRSRALIRSFEWLEDSCLRAADAVITICPALQDYAVPRMSEARRHFLIENSLFDPVRLRRSAEGDRDTRDGDDLPEGRPIVSYAGTFESYQGIEILIDAFTEVRRKRPDAFLLMIGGTAEQVEAARRRASARGLDGDVRFTGRIDQNEVRALLERADVLTSPRSAGTNTPLKVYEQLASGKPLVATRIWSHTQVLSDDVCFLVDPEPGPMAEGILAALEPGARRDAVVAAARALYETRYSPAAYLGKMKRLLESLA